MKKIIIGLIVIAVAVLGFFFYKNSSSNSGVSPIKSGVSDATGKIKLVYAVHWQQKDQTDGLYENGVLKHKGLQQYLDEYHQLNPNVEIDIKKILYGEYANTLKVLSDSDMPPDIYQIYSPWGVSYVRDGILNAPPQYIVDDVTANYISTAGVKIDGKIWGIPTEINTFALLYNKDLFKKAGLVDSKGNAIYPKTWSELVSAATKLTKKDANGNITQYGIAFNNEDWQVVDPFLSLLYSNGGKYLAPDFSKSLFNSPEGVQALDAELQLFKAKATDLNGNTFDFKDGKVAMVIVPPWIKATFASSFGDKFESSVGVVPVPFMKKQTATGYSWFAGVMEKSKNKDEAWKFLKWFTSDIQPGIGTTRYGDLLAGNIGAIPSRKVDFEAHKEVLGDFFTNVYVGQMKSAVPEPNVFRSSDIKGALMKEILSAWSGSKTAKEALDAAAVAVDKILLNK